MLECSFQLSQLGLCPQNPSKLFLAKARKEGGKITPGINRQEAPLQHTIYCGTQGPGWWFGCCQQRRGAARAPQHTGGWRRGEGAASWHHECILWQFRTLFNFYYGIFRLVEKSVRLIYFFFLFKIRFSISHWIRAATDLATLNSHTGYSQILKPEAEGSRSLLSWQAFLKWSSFSPPNQLTLPQGPQRQGRLTPARCPEHRLLQVALGSHSLTVPAFQKNPAKKSLPVKTYRDHHSFLWKQSILSTSFCKFCKNFKKTKRQL